MQQKSQLPFSFTGSGGEYFRIWIVNVFLTIVTLGIYSAWAKVRRNQYFYRNTWLDDANFDYHGQPIAILKGRILAVILLVTYNITLEISHAAGLVVLAAIALVMPVLLLKSFRFRAINTSYRGLRFGFSAPLKEAYKTFLLLPVLTLLTAYLLTPFTHQRIKKFQHGHSRYGTTGFHFDAPVKEFYKIYGVIALLYILIVMAVVFMAVGARNLPGLSATPDANPFWLGFAFMGAVVMALVVVVGPYFAARMQNLIWNHTSLGDGPKDELAVINPAYYASNAGSTYQFVSTVRARGFFWLYLTNLVGIVLTFGLFKPFADIRLARYKISNLQVNATGNPADLVRAEQGEVHAFGEETAEIFDLDIAL